MAKEKPDAAKNGANRESRADDGAVELPVEDALDLHAFHPRDTAAVVDEYLWEAQRRGFDEVRIIHGKGLGVQRRIVAGVLERHPAVASFRMAAGERGHYGATIVRLRPASPAGRG